MSGSKKSAWAVVRNPLTVIAVFAGLAEVSATVALPQLQLQLASVFIWFVMLFPTLLIGLFFFTLWKKHHVLYAPSDYVNEDNFMRHWVRSESPPLIEEIEDVPEEIGEAPASIPSSQNDDQQVQADEPRLSIGYRDHSQRMAETRLVEDKVVRSLSEKYRLNFLRDAELRDRRDIRYDAVADSPGGPILVEVKIVSNPVSAPMIVRRELERLAAVTYRLEEGELKGAKLILVLVLRTAFPEDEIAKLRALTARNIQRANLPISVELEIRKMDELQLGDTQ